LPRPDIFEYAQNLDLKFLHSIAGEHGAADAMLAGADVFQRKNIWRGIKIGRERKRGQDRKQLHSSILAARGD
jgi:hypothetical protein